MSSPRELVPNDLLNVLSDYFDGMTPTQYIRQLLKEPNSNWAAPENINFIIFILEAFVPIEESLQQKRTPLSVYAHWAKVIKQRFAYLAETPALQYQHGFQTRVNRLSVQLANLCAVELKCSPYQILFPTLKNLDNPVTMTNIDDLALCDFILTEDGTDFIPLDDCFEVAKESGEFMHGMMNAGCFTSRPLTALEMHQLQHHSSCTVKLVEAIESLEQFRSGKFTVGYHLRKLIHGLHDGSSHREGKYKTGTDKIAGGEAAAAISEFNEFYNEQLTAEQRAELNAMRCDHHDFLHYRRQLGMDAEERKQKIVTAAKNIVKSIRDDETRGEIIQRVKLFINAQAAERINEIPKALQGHWQNAETIQKIIAQAGSRCRALDFETTETNIHFEIKVFLGRWVEEEWQSILSGIYECVYLTGGGLQALLTNNKERLFSMVVAAEVGQQESLKQHEKRVAEYQEEFNENYLAKMRKNGIHKPLWVRASFNEDDALLQSWFEHVALSHFKEIMTVLVKFINPNAYVYIMNMITCMNESQQRYLMQEHSESMLKWLQPLVTFLRIVENRPQEEVWQTLFERLANTILNENKDFNVGRAVYTVKLRKTILTFMSYSKFCNLNTMLSGGMTLLMKFAIENNTHGVQLMLELGANPDVVIKGKTAIMCAIEKGNFNVISLLQPVAKLTINQAFACLLKVDGEIISQIIEILVSMVFKDMSADELFRLGVVQGCGALVQYTLTNYEVNQALLDEPQVDGDTPIIIFTRLHDLATVVKIFEHGGRLNLANTKTGETARSIIAGELLLEWPRWQDDLIPHVTVHPSYEKHVKLFNSLSDGDYLPTDTLLKRITSAITFDTFKLILNEIVHCNNREPRVLYHHIMKANASLKFTREQSRWIQTEFADELFAMALDKGKQSWEEVCLQEIRKKSLSLSKVDMALCTALITSGKVDVNYRESNSGQTILMAACVSGHAKLVQALLENKSIKLEEQDAEGSTAYLIAAKSNSTAVMPILQAAGANILAQNHAGDNVLTILANKLHIFAVEYLEGLPQGSESMLRMMVSHCNKRGESFVDFVMGWNNVESLSRAFKFIDIGQVDEHGFTYLMRAVQEENTLLLLGIVSQRVEIDKPHPETGKTALMMAIEKGLLKNVLILLRSGARVDLSDVHGLTAIDYAKKSKDNFLCHTVEYCQHHTLVDLFWFYAQAGNLQMLEMLEIPELGMRMDMVDSEGRNALVYAAQHQDIQFAKAVVQERYLCANSLIANALRWCEGRNQHREFCFSLARIVLKDYAERRECEGGRHGFFSTVLSTPNMSDKLAAVRALLAVLAEGGLYENRSLASYLLAAAHRLVKHAASLSDGRLHVICKLLLGDKCEAFFEKLERHGHHDESYSKPVYKMGW